MRGACMIAFAAAVVMQQSSSSEAAPPAKPRAEVPQAVYDFGSVVRGEKVNGRFTIGNAGSADLVLGDMQFLGAGVATVRLRGRIPPGRAGDVAVTIDTKLLIGDVETGVAFATNDPERSRIELRLKGRVKQPAEFVPKPVVSIVAFQNDSAAGSVALVNNDSVPLRITGIETRGSLFRVELDTVKEGADYRVRVVSSPDAPPGRHEERVTLRTSNRRVPQLSIVVNLLVRNRVYAFPEKIDFGTVRLGDVVHRPKFAGLPTRTVVVKRRGGDDFRIEIDNAGPFVSVVTSPPGAGGYRLDVSLVPEKLARGRIDGTVRVRTNDAEFPEIAIPIRGEVL